ncbi:hypothetical protein GCM10010924_46000 [Rhizobium wenxiniae]|nr:hypothetical protein GCM10010924_46000 [Rhizobium wenxiniae]
MPRQRLRAWYRWPAESLTVQSENETLKETVAGIYQPPFFCLKQASNKGGRAEPGIMITTVSPEQSRKAGNKDPIIQVIILIRLEPDRS